MALTFDEVQLLLKGEKLRFFLDPDRPVARFGITGEFGKYDIVVNLQEEGRFLQFRTVSLLMCPASHPHLNAVLRVLAEENFRRRLVKLGWDASDGEIIAYADLWVMDGTVTQGQFGRMMSNYLPTVDSGFHRIKTTHETGNDPGEEGAVKALESRSGGPGGGGGLPGPLRDLLDKLRGKKEGDKPPIREI